MHGCSGEIYGCSGEAVRGCLGQTVPGSSGEDEVAYILQEDGTLSLDTVDDAPHILEVYENDSDSSNSNNNVEKASPSQCLQQSLLLKQSSLLHVGVHMQKHLQRKYSLHYGVV